MCPQTTGREKEFRRRLPLAVFEKVVDDAIRYGLETVSLHGSGEPTMNREMPEMVKAVKGRGLVCTSLTNGFELTEDKAEALMGAGIDLIRISAIGSDRESYRNWMGVDGYERVRDNVKRCVDLKRKMGARTEIHLYHLVTDLNDKDREVARYRVNWADFTGALSEIWLMHNWSGSLDGPYDRSRLAGGKTHRSCGRPFSPVLQVRAGGLDGHHAAVVACCMVLGKDSEAVLGHLDSQTIREVVDGEPFQALRLAHREGRFADISYCRDCDQLLDLPEALVWSNIPGRYYGASKHVSALDFRTFAESSA
jgi:hypothetical protein